MNQALKQVLHQKLIQILSRRAHSTQAQSFIRVYGSEHELAVEFDDTDNISDEEERDAYLEKSIVDHTTPNGGRVYVDLKHLEMCTPETSNVLDAIRYEKAMERYCINLLGSTFKPRIYKTCRDEKRSFGAHQNFLTTLRPTVNERKPLLLFSVVEKLLTGAGYQHPDGSYELSQRVPFIEQCLNDDTRDRRALLNLREETLTDAKGFFYRFHHISNDPNMCERALALKMGLWDLVLTLAENALLPNIPYDESKAVDDMKSICRKHSNWTLEGTPQDYRRATDVLRAYHDVMKIEFTGQNALTDKLLLANDETLTLLERIEDEPYALAGKLDWVTKKMLTELCMGNTGLTQESDLIQSINIDYHCIDSGGLFYQTQAQDGWIERWVSDKEIDDALLNPPLTRANVRGRARQLYEQSPLKGQYDLNIRWGRVALQKKKSNSIAWSCELTNNAYHYPEKIDELEKILHTTYDS